MKIGIQLYSVRNHMAENPIETVRRVVGTGYRNLEVANHNALQDSGVGFGVPARDMKALLGDLNAEVFSAHIYPLDPARMGPILDYHAEIGTKFFVEPIVFYEDRDDVLRKAEAFNAVGERCRTAGMEFLYHNHYQEFQTFGRETVYELLMNNTDPALVKIELDTYWTMRAGQDPAALLKKFGKRVRLVHQKDFPKGAEDRLNLLASRANARIDMESFSASIAPDTFTEIGTGVIDIQKIIDTANSACESAYIVLEQDHSRYDELESIRISMESFRRFKGIEW
jgi:sugar phosphate isomerase/epimerase